MVVVVGRIETEGVGRSVGAHGTVTIRLVKRLEFMSVTDRSVIRERVRFVLITIFYIYKRSQMLFYDLTFGIWTEICSSYKEKRVISKRI